MKIAVQIRLRDKHAAHLERQARSINFVWNYCNETSEMAWRRDRRWLSAYDLQKLTAGSYAELGLHSNSIGRACKQFAQSRDKAKKCRLRWRGRRSLGWVPFNTGSASFDGVRFKFHGHHYEAMHLHPRLRPGMRFGAGSFNQDARGRWYINVPIDVEVDDTAKNPAACGVDLGLKSLATLSDGRSFETPRFYRASELALATAQRARKSKRARTIQMKAANRRKDHLHKLSAQLTKEFGLIVVGDVSPSKLARTKMAKSIHDAGWSDFKRMLSYKAIMHGGRTIEVDERWSTQTCSGCGTLPTSRPRGIAGLGIREWECSDCGTVHDRDANAARNILRLGLETLAEGAVS